MKAFFIRMWAVFPLVLVPTLAVLMGRSLFGPQHISIGLALIFYNAMTARQPFTVGRFVIDVTTILGLAAASLIAGGSLFCSILLNGLVFFLMIVCFSDELTLGGYYIYGLVYLLGQTKFPMSFGLLPGRLASLGFGFAVILVYKLYRQKVKPVGLRKGLPELFRRSKSKDSVYESTRKHLMNRLSPEALAQYREMEMEADDSAFSLSKNLWIRIKYRWKFRPCYLGFAVKMAVAMSLGFAVSHLLGFEQIHWLPITVYAMTLPSFETTKQKAYTTFYGTVGGAVLFVLVFRHIPASLSMVFLVLVICCVFSIKNELVKRMISTQLSLVLSSSDLSHFHFAGLRIAVVFGAMLVALLINYISSKSSHPNGIPINAIRIRKINDEVLEKLNQPVKTPQAACYRNLMLLEVLALEDKIRPYQK